MKFILATRNPGKIREMNAILQQLGWQAEALPADAPEPVEDGSSFAENALIKARSAAKFTGLPAIADDSGLCVDALNGAPGIYSARFCEGTDEDRNDYLLKKLISVPAEKRDAHYTAAIACILPDGKEITVEGQCYGRILNERHGTGGFGYDPLFYLPDYGCTFGELPAAEKNKISHRGKALQALKQALEQWK